MPDCEVRTRHHAIAVGAPQGLHKVDGRDLVALQAGWIARICAETADKGGRMKEMRAALEEAMEHAWVAACERQFAALLVVDCNLIAGQHLSSPGDAVRAAFEWTGWVHDSRRHGASHSSGTVAYACLRSCGTSSMKKRAALQGKFLSVVTRHLITPEAIYAAYTARVSRDGAYWPRRWAEVSQLAVDEVFGREPPPKLQVSMQFTYRS